MESVKVTEKMLKESVPKLRDELVLEWEKKYSNMDCEYSEARIKQIKNSIMGERQKQKKLARNRMIHRWGMVAAACIIFGVVFMSNETKVYAAMKYMFHKVETILNGGVEYMYKTDTDLFIDTEYEPGYIPEGYKEVSRDIDDYRVIIQYADAKGDTISWQQYFASDGLVIGMDSEFDRLVKKSFLDEDANIYIQEDSYTRLYYEKDNSVFMISSTNLSEDDIFRMLTEMKKIEK